jgi:hypothetical protein
MWGFLICRGSKFAVEFLMQARFQIYSIQHIQCKVLNLTKTEYKLPSLMLASPERVFTRDLLLDAALDLLITFWLDRSFQKTRGICSYRFER